MAKEGVSEPPAPPPPPPAVVPEAEGMYSFSCSHCGSVIDATPDMAGLEGFCPDCDHEIKVPPPPKYPGPQSPPKATADLRDSFLAQYTSFRCSHCGQYIEMSRERCGQRVDCPACEWPLVVPEAGRSIAESADSDLKPVPADVSQWRKGATIRIDLGGALDALHDRRP